MTLDEFYNACERLLTDECHVSGVDPKVHHALWDLGSAIERLRPGVAGRMADRLLERDRRVD